MAYIGKSIESGTFALLDTSGNTYNGSNTTFSLGTQVGSPAQLLVSHDGVLQKPGTDYSLASGGTQITFSTAPASGASIFIVEISGAVGGPLDSDLNGSELILDADGDTSITADTDDQIDIKVAGADDFQIVANNFKVLSGSTLTVESGATITNSGTANGFGALAGIDDQSSSNDDQLTITDTAVVINEDSDDVDFRVETDDLTHAFFIDGANDEVTLNESAGDADAGGLCMNTGSSDGFALTFKNSDVAHFTTNEAENDTYMRLSKYSSSQGGGAIVGYAEGGEAMYLQGICGGGQSSTTKSTSAGAPVIIKGTVEASNAASALPSNHNAAVIMNHTNTRFIFDGDGDFHADSSSTTFDAYDDAQLVRAYDLSHGKGVIDSKFDKFVAYNHEKLAELKLVGREENGTPNHFVNVTGMQRLHNGAIWQQYEKHNQLLEAVYDLAKEAVGEEKANAILEKHNVKRLQ